MPEARHPGEDVMPCYALCPATTGGYVVRTMLPIGSVDGDVPSGSSAPYFPWCREKQGRGGVQFPPRSTSLDGGGKPIAARAEDYCTGQEFPLSGNSSGNLQKLEPGKRKNQ